MPLNRLKIEVLDQVLIKKAHFQVDGPNRIMIEFTMKKFRLFLFERLRCEFEIELNLFSLLTTRFDFGGGF